ncbi:MAG: outer membrane beta-barrel protein [Bacteroidia bacterium]|nr:outer membrane beta-barrel protein [Bacteroidia bacterium]
MKRILLLWALFTFISNAQSQMAYRTFNGRVVDSATLSPLADATVSIYRASDTLLLNFGFTTPLGNFSLVAKSSDSLIIVISLLNYNDKIYNEPMEEGWNFKSFNDVKMSVMPKTFAGVTFRVSAIRMHGDTIEINANKFKVLPGSDVAQLFKKIPGFEVNVKGEIKVNGSDVSKIMVDGSDFFGNNPAMVSKNLNADMIETVQVFDDKNEDGSPKESSPKIINLKLKKGKRNGVFGDFLGGYGTQERYEAGARINSFKNDRKFSVIVNKNNINGTGFDFGFNNWHSVDNYSRNGSGNESNYFVVNRYMPSDGNINNKTNAGLTYFNEFSKRRKLSFNLDYDHNNFFTISSSNTNIALDDSTNRLSVDSSYSKGTVNRMAGNIGFSKNIDSTGYFEIGVDGNFSLNNNTFETFNDININEININQGIGEIKGDNTSGGGSLNISYRRNLRKDKRYVFSVFSSSKFTSMANKQFQFQENLSDTFNVRKTIDYNSFESLSRLYGRLPLYKTSLFLNVSADRWSQNNTNKQVTTGAQNAISRAFEQNYTASIDTLSIHFDNSQIQYTIKPYVSFEKKFLYASAGATFLNLTLNNNNITENSSFNKPYNKFLPYLYVSYYPNGKGWFNLNLSKSSIFPTTGDLQPVLNVSNNYERSTGNENLQPQDNYSMRIYGNFYKVRGFRYLYGSINGNLSDNVKVMSKTQNENGVLIQRPENASGMKSLSGYFSTSKKITKTFNIGSSINASSSQNPMLINNFKSYSISNSFYFSPFFSFTYSDSLEFSIGMNWNSSNFRNELNSSLNFDQNTYAYSLSIRTVLKFGTEINSELDIQDSRNIPNIGKFIPVWSAYLQQPLGKSNFNLKITAYDILKQNTQISRTANYNFIIIQKSNQLQQYFMLTLVYKIKKMGGDEDGGFVF